MYESRELRPLASAEFLRRLLQHFALSAGMLVFSILLGLLGYWWFEGLGPVDGFLNSAMLLGGMGPVTMPQTTAGKLFAGCYALYSGLLFIVTAAIMVTPVAHRLLHRFHREEDGEQDE